MSDYSHSQSEGVQAEGWSGSKSTAEEL